jgi:response regulator RpfG family c-di-GMP phosphodiesterase
MMQAERGCHFDPAVLDAFLECRDEVDSIHAASRDG